MRFGRVKKILVGTHSRILMFRQGLMLWFNEFFRAIFENNIMLSFDKLLPWTEWYLGLSKRSWLVLIQEFCCPDKKWTINWVHSEKQVRILMPFLQNRFNSVIQSITQIQTNISRSRSSLLLSCMKENSHIYLIIGLF